MFDVVSFADIDGQHVELLPARTLLTTNLVGGGLGGFVDGVARTVGGLATVSIDVPATHTQADAAAQADPSASTDAPASRPGD